MLQSKIYTKHHKYQLSHVFGENIELDQNETPRAIDGDWWTCDISRKELKSLMKRENRRPLIDYFLWLALLIGSGVFAYLSLDSAIGWSILAFFVYGTIYSSCDPRSHDLGHGTAFKTSWINDVFRRLCLFLTMKEPIDWRWRHARHHTDTIHVGYDPEILVKRPADLIPIFADFFFLTQAKGELQGIFTHAMGRVTGDPRYYVPRSEWPKIIRSARLYVAAIAIVVGYCIWMQSAVPLLFIWGPRIYANWLNYFGFLSQHAGLREDSHDHRLNTRTFLMMPPLEFLYNNMNYHIEHHLHPLIPFYNLPKLHWKVRDQLPKTYGSLFEVTRETVPVVWRQAFEPDYFVTRKLPESATPSSTMAPATSV